MKRLSFLLLLLVALVFLSCGASTQAKTTSQEFTDPVKQEQTVGKIAFYSDRSGNWELFVIDSDGKNLINLTNVPVSSFCWSPDGKKIAFISSFDKQQFLYEINSDGSGLKQLSEGFENPSVNYPNWSPDGTQIIFSLWPTGKQSQIYAFNLNERKLIQLTKSGSNYYPVYSPDGKKIAFCKNIEQGKFNLDIYLMNADGSNQERLTYARVIAFPVWSPHGDKIAFTQDVQREKGSVWGNDSAQYMMVIDIDGRNQINLSKPFSEISHSPSWSPDGEKIVFVCFSEYTSAKLAIIDADSSNFKMLTGNFETGDPVLDEGRHFDPAFSPDGKKILFVSEKHVGSFSYVIDEDGSNPVKLTDGFNSRSPIWCPVM